MPVAGHPPHRSAFPAASMQMPLAALVLMLEFTRANHDFVIPMLLCIAGSLSTFNSMVQRRVMQADTISPRV